MTKRKLADFRAARTVLGNRRADRRQIQLALRSYTDAYVSSFIGRVKFTAVFVSPRKLGPPSYERTDRHRRTIFFRNFQGSTKNLTSKWTRFLAGLP